MSVDQNQIIETMLAKSPWTAAVAVGLAQANGRIDELASQVATLSAQRDKLLKACQMSRRYDLWSWQSPPDGTCWPWHELHAQAKSLGWDDTKQSLGDFIAQFRAGALVEQNHDS